MAAIYVNGVKTSCIAMVRESKKSNDISLIDSYYVVDSSAAATKTSKSFTVISGDTVLLAVMRRANVTAPTGFELIAESDAPLDGYQTLSIYKKVFDSDYTGTFQITNETSTSRCSLMIIQLRGNVTTSILTKLASNASGSYTYTLPTFERPCIFFCQNTYADSNAYSWDFGSKFYISDCNNVSSKVYLSEFMQNNGPSSRLDMIAYLGDKKVNGKTITCSQSFSEIIGIALTPDNGGGGDSPIHYKNYAKFNGYGLQLPYTINADYKITVEFYQTTYSNNESIIGNISGSSYVHLTPYSNSYYTSTGSSEEHFGTWSAGEHIFVCNNGNNHNEFDGVEVTSYTPTTNSTKLTIGERNTANPCYSYIKRYKIESISTGNKICELIPCLYDNVTPCLYDTVNKKFYYPEDLQVMDEIPTT